MSEKSNPYFGAREDDSLAVLGQVPYVDAALEDGTDAFEFLIYSRYADLAGPHFGYIRNGYQVSHSSASQVEYIHLGKGIRFEIFGRQPSVTLFRGTFAA